MDVIYKLPKENGGASAEGCVRYDQEQTLTDEQQQQAKDNLGIEDPEPQAAVLYDQEQTLTEEQQQQACENIGAAQVIYIELENSIEEMTNAQFSEIINSFIGRKDKKFIIRVSTVARALCYPVLHAVVGSATQNQELYLLKEPGIFIKIYKSGFNLKFTEKNTYPYNPTVTINQGGVTKGSFTLNQSTAATIDLDAGSSSEGCVRYDQAQTLTTAQRKQAAGNLGAVRVEKYGSEPPADIRSLSDAAKDGFPALWHNEDDGGEDSRLIIASFKDGWASDSTRCIFAAELVKEYTTIKPQFVLLRQSDFDEGDVQKITYPILPEAPSDNKQYARCNRNWVEVEAGSAENHQLLRNALSEPLGCQANTWHTLCEVTVPEDGVYQVSASVCAQPATETSYNAVIVGIATRTGSGDPTEHQEIQLPRSGEYGTMSVPVNATAGQKIQLLAYSSSNFYAQAVPSTGKASATFIAAVRVGATYTE